MPLAALAGFLGIPQLSNFFWVYLFVLVTVVTVHNLVNSSYGRAFISIRDDEIAAEAMGVDTTRFKVMSFVISSMFAGIAGGLFGHFTMFLHPNSFQFTTSFYLIIMIVVGGLGSIEGAILGAILMTVVLEVFREFGAVPPREFCSAAGADHAVPAPGTCRVPGVCSGKPGRDSDVHSQYPAVHEAIRRSRRGQRPEHVAAIPATSTD